MKKQQFLLVGLALLAVILLYFFGKTVPTAKLQTSAPTSQQTERQTVKFEDLLLKAKGKISASQNERLLKLENSVVRGDIKEQQIHVYHQLARFWADSAHIFEPYAFYNGEAAKLENTEKSLTFAAHLFLDNLMTEGQPAMQYWLASNSKVLFEKAIIINPANDSSKIGLGACFLFGNISEPVDNAKGKSLFSELAGQMLAKKKSALFNQAIMDFGATICKPFSPNCNSCPLQKNCMAFQKGMVNQLPVFHLCFIPFDLFIGF